ncbi:hypothetical protein AAFF_G00107130 [Aldrovandia affinis]|uniref:Uncharacterized protein n=1 Tax=Aldrovandia affinis TaxID=143900 RepID=A0AAD7T2G6_9TELE|nr:hypothetical protein AAFF_G00107130 [Aldrovandia affinis]
MAEAADCVGGSLTRSAHSSADSTTPAMVPTTLEDLVEEEDVFLPESNNVGGEGTEDSSGNATVTLQVLKEAPITERSNQMENEFLHLAIRKQVSYRQAVTPLKPLSRRTKPAVLNAALIGCSGERLRASQRAWHVTAL